MMGGEDPEGKVDGEEKRATRSYAMKLLYVWDIENWPGREVAPYTTADIWISKAVKRFAPGLSRQSADKTCIKARDS